MFCHQGAKFWPNLNKFVHTYLKTTHQILHRYCFICCAVLDLQWIQSLKLRMHRCRSDIGPILTQIAGSGIGDNRANIFHSVLFIYYIYYILEFQFLFKFSQSVAALKRFTLENCNSCEFWRFFTKLLVHDLLHYYLQSMNLFFIFCFTR